MFIAEALSASKFRWIEQTQGSIVADIAYADLHACLTIGGMNAVLVAPTVHHLSKLLSRNCLCHIGNITLNSVTVNTSDKK